MFMLFIIYFHLNCDIMVVNFTDDSSVELVSKMSGLILWKCLSNLECLNWKCQ